MGDATKTLGEHLLDGFNATFIGGGWAEPLAWEDFDEAQQARYETAAKHLLARASVPEGDQEASSSGVGLPSSQGGSDPIGGVPLDGAG